jgi:murein DD-endopeptidase MepM/ murein hydrolase activator NlpD
VAVFADGVVTNVEENENAIVASPTGGYCGRYVVVLHSHPNGRAVYTRYAQLGRLVGSDGRGITPGRRVKDGDKIGETGKAGIFHFEVRPVNNKTAYPEPLAGYYRDMEWARYQPVDPATFDIEKYVTGTSATKKTLHRKAK